MRILELRKIREILRSMEIFAWERVILYYLVRVYKFMSVIDRFRVIQITGNAGA